MRSFLILTCLFSLLSCTHSDAIQMQRPKMVSFSWKMYKAGILTTLSFDRGMELDSSVIHYGVEIINSATGNTYGGNYMFDIVSLKGRNQLKRFFPMDYFATDSVYKDLLLEKKSLRVKLFVIYSSPVSGKLVKECGKKPRREKEYYFFYRVLQNEKTLGPDALKQNSKMDYTINDMSESTCKMIHYTNR